MRKSEKIIILDKSHESDWNAFVENHPCGWICHHTEWKNFLEKCYSHIRGMIVAILKDDKIIAGLPVYSVKSVFTGKRLVSIPYATLSDFLVSDQEQVEKIIHYLEEYRRLHGYRFIEIRTKQTNHIMRMKGWNPHYIYKHHQMKLDANEDELFKSFHHSCVQRRLKRKNSEEVLIQTAASSDDVLSFYKLHVMTRRRVGLPPFPIKHIEKISRLLCFKNKGRLYLASHNGMPIAGLLLLKFKNRVSVEIQCSDEHFIKMSPNHFLYWQAIRDAKKERFEIFDFGRTDPENKGLVQFKERWGTSVNDIGIYIIPQQADVAGYMTKKTMSAKVLRKIIYHMPTSILAKTAGIIYNHRA